MPKGGDVGARIRILAMRAGIGIYGLMPDLPAGIVAPKLYPAMSLKGRIVYLKEAVWEEKWFFIATTVLRKQIVLSCILHLTEEEER